MASLDQVLQLGAGQGLQRPTPPATARPGTATGAPPPLLAQAMAGMEPGGPPMMQDPFMAMFQQMEGPEIPQLFGAPPDVMPPLSILDLARLLRMRESWNDGPADYGAIL